MVEIARYIPAFYTLLPMLRRGTPPWQLTAEMPAVVAQIASGLGAGYREEGGVWLHATAVVEPGAVVKAPAVLSAGCFVAAGAYLRGGVYLGAGVTVGPGSEVKASIVLDGSTAAHFNFVGDAILGREVNLEAGAVLANHFNERVDREVVVYAPGAPPLRTGATKFGALVGDGTRIGANAVLLPGTVLPAASVVERLALVDQSKG